MLHFTRTVNAFIYWRTCCAVTGEAWRVSINMTISPGSGICRGVWWSGWAAALLTGRLWICSETAGVGSSAVSWQGFARERASRGQICWIGFLSILACPFLDVTLTLLEPTHQSSGWDPLFVQVSKALLGVLHCTRSPECMNETSLRNIAFPYRALFSGTERYCIEQYFWRILYTLTVTIERSATRTYTHLWLASNAALKNQHNASFYGHILPWRLVCKRNEMKQNRICLKTEHNSTTIKKGKWTER